MSGSYNARATRARLLDVIGAVRRRWRMKVLLRGLLITCSAGLLLFIAAAYGLERMNFAAGAVMAFRMLAIGTVLALIVRFIALPLRRPVTNEQVALYLEEHEPSLQNTLISALDADGINASPALAQRTVEYAVERCREIDDGRAVDRRDLHRFAAAVAVTLLFGIGLTGFGPPLFRQGAGSLLNPYSASAHTSPYRVDVQPGDATIARGSDQIITAILHGWDERAGSIGVAQQVEILMRTAGDSMFQRIPLTTVDGAAQYEVLLFDVANATEYYIEADGVRSPMYRIDVADLPYVESIQLVYDYPDYTGLPDEIVEDGGDIVALRGSRVSVRANTTMPVMSARIVLDGGRNVHMEPGPDGVLEGVITVTGEGFYTIELTTADSVTVSGSPQYLIDVIDDRGPGVRITKPGHDIRPTTIEEVFVEASAEDDFGVARLELVFSVN
ncbi:MAG: hypothetical protein KFH98_14160, partial [Gemmatimonadetes bacterium]|nr:hypothetical protein [Gemmatimonadota bacterium]